MDYEKIYYELLEKMDRAKDRVAQMPYSLKIRDDFEFARTEFLEYCTEILEKLMEENIDVLKILNESIDKYFHFARARRFTQIFRSKFVQFYLLTFSRNVVY